MSLSELVKILQKEYPLHLNQTSLRFSEHYTLIETEIQKLSSLHGEKPDYQVVLIHAQALLEDGSNDLLLLSYLGLALLEKYQWQGCLPGLNLMSKRLKDHWISLVPEKQKSKVTALSWLLERYQNFFTKKTLQSLSKELLENLYQSLIDFNEQLTEKFPQELNALYLLKQVEAQLQRLNVEANSKAEKLKAEQENQRLQKEAELAQTLQKNAENISVDDYLAQINTLELYQLSSKRLLQERLEILVQQPLTFAIFKHNRTELWWHYPYSAHELLNIIDHLGLDWDTFSQALEQKATQNYVPALIQFEKCFVNHPYFLELQMHISDCLQALGAEASLLTMLKQETQQLLDIYPELIEAKINNKFAVLTKVTKDFLDRI